MTLLAAESMTCPSSSISPLLRPKPTNLSFVDQELSNGVFISARRHLQRNLGSRLTKQTVPIPLWQRPQYLRTVRYGTFAFTVCCSSHLPVLTQRYPTFHAQRLSSTRCSLPIWCHIYTCCQNIQNGITLPLVSRVGRAKHRGFHRGTGRGWTAGRP